MAQMSRDDYEKYFYKLPLSSKPFYDFDRLVYPREDTIYYFYILNEVIAYDLFSVFESSPDFIFDKILGQQLRKYIYENSSDNSQADINDFLGREWNYNNYIKYYNSLGADI